MTRTLRLDTVAACIGASWIFTLQDHGVSIVGLIPQGLPGLIMPDWSLIARLVPAALGIALMSYTETIAAGRAFAVQGDPPIKPDRELLATGVANLGGAFFGSTPAGGGTSQTAVVRAVGAQTRHRYFTAGFGSAG